MTSTVQPEDQDSSATIVILCNLCRFRGLRSGAVVNHLSQHPSMNLYCGIDYCAKSYVNLGSFKKHLSRHHSNFYPTIIGGLPNIDPSSVFSVDLLGPNTNINDQRNSLQVEQIQSEGTNSPSMFVPSPINFLHETPITVPTKQFLQILVEGGCQFNTPFKSIQQLSSSLVTYFFDLYSNGLLNEDLKYNLLHVINSSDQFDNALIDMFDAIFPHQITIENTNYSFVCFPFKKTLDYLLKKFDSFAEITKPDTLNPNNICSFFTASPSIESNTIYINLYLDDFQLANPLLRKSSLKNSITGIYFRIVTSDNFKFSTRDNIHVLSLINSKVFKDNTGVIFHYLAQEINTYLNNPFFVTIGSETRLVTLKIAFFSTDSLAASFVLGFKGSFNHNYCCRECTCTRENFKTTFSEDSVSIRTHKSFLNSYAEISNLQDGEDHYGIIRVSDIRHFNCPDFSKLFPFCIDHDIFEGILPRIVQFSLDYFVRKKYFTYNMFKLRVKSFNFLGKDKDNFPLIDFESQSKIRFTASEGYTFIRFFLLFLHNIPLDDPVYLIVDHLVKIVLILMSFNFSFELLTILENLVSNFLFMCSQYAEGLPITVKFHHLIHYPRLITIFGPPRLFSTINFESLHSHLKSKIKNSKNWQSVCYTIATKYARSQVFRNESKSLEFGSKLLFQPLPELLTSFQNNEIVSLSALKQHNNHYKCHKSAIFFKNRDQLEFLEIEHIFKIQSQYFFYGNIYVCFNENNYIYFGPFVRKDYVVLSNLYNRHSYEIYHKDSNKFIVPYYYIEPDL